MQISRRSFVLSVAAMPVAAWAQDGFAAWVAGFRARSRARGFSEALLDAAFSGVRYNQQVVDQSNRQAEFTRPLWDYLDLTVSPERVTNGRAAFRQQSQTLAALERAYGVPAQILCAVWGMESAYGARRGDFRVVEALSSLAAAGRRRTFAEEQLTAALRIMARGDIEPQLMMGSWAGAMGHTQFIPTSFLAYGIDATGDGRRDIWGADPTDALASTANYLARAGWRRGQPWGQEVRLSARYDFAQSGGQSRMPSEWAQAGVTDLNGRAVPDHGSARVLTPAGARGPALMVFSNFRAILRYNNAESYAIAVGHLGDRLAGSGGFAASWPRGDRALTGAEAVELQQRLARAGFDPGPADGRPGRQTQAALRAWQRSRGMPADGVPVLSVLEALRRR